LAGICAAFGVSPLLACMALGTAYINLSGNTELFDQVSGFAPVILTMFFVLSGMRLDVPALLVRGIGVSYFLVRIVGKFAGAYLGAGLSGGFPRGKAVSWHGPYSPSRGLHRPCHPGPTASASRHGFAPFNDSTFVRCSI